MYRHGRDLPEAQVSGEMVTMTRYACPTVACSCLWALAVFKAWPEEIERWAEEETSGKEEEAE